MRAWRMGVQPRERVALVPTMGGLHTGHLALVRAALAECEHVVCSVFVNPLQFSANEDLSRYPRTLAHDRELLIAQGAHVLWAPSEQEIFPHVPLVTVHVHGLERVCEVARCPLCVAQLDRPRRVRVTLTAWQRWWANS